MFSKNQILTFVGLVLLGCTNENINQKQNLRPKEALVEKGKLYEKEQIATKKRLRYIYFANGGLITYFNDGTVTGCPKCDFCRGNIANMFYKAPHATYTVEKDGSLLVDGQEKFYPEPNSEHGAGWALIDYKWVIKPPQY